MLRGFYGAASGMITQQRRTEMLTDNISNLRTPGYKEDHGSIRTFPEMLLQARGGSSFGGSTPIGSLATGVYMQERTPNVSQGDLMETGNATDAALLQGALPENAALFFTVTNEEGEVRYTRNGNWAVDGAGFLTTGEGYYVLGADGEPLDVENENFRLLEDGTVMHENGEVIGQVGIAYAENANDMVKEGNSLLRSEAGELPAADADFQLQQGFLERSNVDANRTMTELMSAYRLFESNQRIMQAYDQNMQRAVNDVGRLG
ncbi:flagellar hook-basal body protein [Alteribacillus iranensis]|uniref:Flagellar basal-body rod protein FlgG n=1 Tax=Alteribacillus iranensis TaxID=930128 RepID=A0A1I2BY90_9BACI|nr:flagellar hook-basal body protein [Alteribacillus iranensis]SFE60902.1 flagellar basal-body rod protein FlgG [Alteribacillus iranensis]